MAVQGILEFDAVEYRTDGDPFCRLCGATFTLQAGAVLVVHADPDSEQVPLTDLATGLIRPTAGAVRFAGHDWEDMTAFAAAAARGQIGCVPEMPGWISSLTVRQNMLLCERHHTSRSEEALYAEADALCRVAGLDAIPECRPDRVRPRTLRMFEWVRAFMGTPRLVLLAFPERGTFADRVTGLMALAERALATGTALAWISDRREVWKQPLLAAGIHVTIQKGQWTGWKEQDDR